MNRERCSATVITCNEARNLRDCLATLAWADEIVVVDSGSTDGTLEIAREHTDRVFVHPWPGHLEQKNYAVDRAAHPWVFSLDADERVPPALADRILEVLAAPAADGYTFPRRNYFLGAWLRHGGWYPDRVLRLFRKDRGRFGGVNPHDRVILASGRAAGIEVPIEHFTYVSLGQYVAKQSLYADIAARGRVESGRASRVGAWRLGAKPAGKFLETYVWKRGFLDGVPGFVAAMGAAFAAYLREARVWELQRTSSMRDEPAARPPAA
ncbi:MAG TPA: glycosyltransferase family 2 protein [Candidatus Paceibacterota bacterium]|nr:glycosyltransferase family 2 protein [Verrucomicrobiota bacterium]HOX03022.1 glycosyltransferase family 2 protein [Verrucomicrobiota bacterium]HRZ45841.1 glycosyltransferase family 2 protein [Candidatus Paceibacterota bacterium]HRZ94560.1 glycosyltransferase family 2 protein [Candidatus Paceibacterota bacterium]